MGQVTVALDQAMKSMDLEKVAKVMDKFESQFEDLDVHASVCSNSWLRCVVISKVSNFFLGCVRFAGNGELHGICHGKHCPTRPGPCAYSTSSWREWFGNICSAGWCCCWNWYTGTGESWSVKRRRPWTKVCVLDLIVFQYGIVMFHSLLEWVGICYFSGAVVTITCHNAYGIGCNTPYSRVEECLTLVPLWCTIAPNDDTVTQEYFPIKWY